MTLLRSVPRSILAAAVGLARRLGLTATRDRLMMPTYPDPAHALMVTRTTEGRDAHAWTASDDSAGHHHGLLSANETPCYLALDWHSRSRGRTVHVGTFKLNLRRLAAAGFAQEKPGGKVRLRFVRDDDGTIEIRANESSPGLPVGMVNFD